MGGEIQDTSKKSVLKAIEQADLLQEVCACVLFMQFWVLFAWKSPNMLLEFLSCGSLVIYILSALLSIAHYITHKLPSWVITALCNVHCEDPLMETLISFSPDRRMSHPEAS